MPVAIQSGMIIKNNSVSTSSTALASPAPEGGPSSGQENDNPLMVAFGFVARTMTRSLDDIAPGLSGAMHPLFHNPVIDAVKKHVTPMVRRAARIAVAQQGSVSDRAWAAVQVYGMHLEAGEPEQAKALVPQLRQSRADLRAGLKDGSIAGTEDVFTARGNLMAVNTVLAAHADEEIQQEVEKAVAEARRDRGLVSHGIDNDMDGNCDDAPDEAQVAKMAAQSATLAYADAVKQDLDAFRTSAVAFTHERVSGKPHGDAIEEDFGTRVQDDHFLLGLTAESVDDFAAQDDLAHGLLDGSVAVTDKARAALASQGFGGLSDDSENRLAAGAIFTSLGLADRVGTTLAPVVAEASGRSNVAEKAGLLWNIAQFHQQAGALTGENGANGIYDQIAGLDDPQNAPLHEIAVLSRALRAVNASDLDGAEVQLKSLTGNETAKGYLDLVCGARARGQNEKLMPVVAKAVAELAGRHGHEDDFAKLLADVEARSAGGSKTVYQALNDALNTPEFGGLRVYFTDGQGAMQGPLMNSLERVSKPSQTDASFNASFTAAFATPATDGRSFWTKTGDGLFDMVSSLLIVTAPNDRAAAEGALTWIGLGAGFRAANATARFVEGSALVKGLAHSTAFAATDLFVRHQGNQAYDGLSGQKVDWTLFPKNYLQEIAFQAPMYFVGKVAGDLTKRGAAALLTESSGLGTRVAVRAGAGVSNWGLTVGGMTAVDAVIHPNANLPFSDRFSQMIVNDARFRFVSVGVNTVTGGRLEADNRTTEAQTPAGERTPLDVASLVRIPKGAAALLVGIGTLLLGEPAQAAARSGISADSGLLEIGAAVLGGALLMARGGRRAARGSENADPSADFMGDNGLHNAYARYLAQKVQKVLREQYGIEAGVNELRRPIHDDLADGKVNTGGRRNGNVEMTPQEENQFVADFAKNFSGRAGRRGSEGDFDASDWIDQEADGFHAFLPIGIADSAFNGLWTMIADHPVITGIVAAVGAGAAYVIKNGLSLPSRSSRGNVTEESVALSSDRREMQATAQRLGKEAVLVNLVSEGDGVDLNYTTLISNLGAGKRATSFSDRSNLMAIYVDPSEVRAVREQITALAETHGGTVSVNGSSGEITIVASPSAFVPDLEPTISDEDAKRFLYMQFTNPTPITDPRVRISPLRAPSQPTPPTGTGDKSPEPPTVVTQPNRRGLR